MNILIDIMNLLWGENNLVRWQVLSFFLDFFLNREEKNVFGLGYGPKPLHINVGNPEEFQRNSYP